MRRIDRDHGRRSVSRNPTIWRRNVRARRAAFRRTASQRRPPPGAGSEIAVGGVGHRREERVGRKHDGRPDLRGRLRDQLVVERRGVEEEPDADQQRQDGAAGQPIGVEDRQHVEQLVFRRQREAGLHLPGVGGEVAAGEHHRLRRPFRPRGEQDDRRLVGVLRGQRPAPHQRGRELLHLGDAGPHIFQPDELRAGIFSRRHDVVEAGLGDEGARRNDGTHDRRADGRRYIGRTGRVVDHRRDPSGRQQADQRHGDAVGLAATGRRLRRARSGPGSDDRGCGRRRTARDR